MIYSDEVRKRIIEYLRIKPSKHGQINVSQVAIPSTLRASLTPAKVEAAVAILKKFNDNLHPVIVRRTDRYGEEQEYEVIFGEEWCEAASEAGLEKLWAWIFDIPDNQIEDIRHLLGGEAADAPPGGIQSMVAEIKAEVQRLREEFREMLKQILQRLPPPLKNINEVTEEELLTSDNPMIRKHAHKIYQFIQEQNGIVSLNQLQAIKGIGEKTIASLRERYTCSR